MKQWNDIYKKEGKNYKYYDIMKPHQDIDRVTRVFEGRNVRRVLDLGCGAGRHIVYLARQGFNVYGIDIAAEGIKIAKESLREQNLKANLKIGNVFERLPYDDNFFDAIISVQVLHHGELNEIKDAIAEIERILRPKGILFMTLPGRYSNHKVRYCLVKTAKKIAPRIYIPTMGNERGMIHYIYNKEILRNHYKNFKTIEIWKDDKGYYCFLGKSKEDNNGMVGRIIR